MSETPTVVIVDDHRIFRSGVRAELGEAVEVLGEAESVEDAVRAITELEAVEAHEADDFVGVAIAGCRSHGHPRGPVRDRAAQPLADVVVRVREREGVRGPEGGQIDIAYRVGIVPDDPRALAATLEDQLVRADVLVTSGGVSVGAYDVVKEVLSRLGTVSFDKVAMQPGMPQGFGTIGPDSTPVFGLPGNPVSALVSFEAFVRPALRTMLGATPVERPRVRAITTEALTSPPCKRSFLRVHLEVKKGAYVVTPVQPGPPPLTPSGDNGGP